MDQLSQSHISKAWQIAWKTANLVISKDRTKIAFLPVVSRGLFSTYEVDAIARCSHIPKHDAPHYVSADDKCFCGFNAFDVREQAVAYMMQPWRARLCTNSLVLMRVALAGTCIEGYHLNHDWGYRAERQVVTDLFLSERCYICGDWVTTDRTGWLLPITMGGHNDFPGYFHIVPVCHEHADASAMTVGQLEAIPGCPDLHWAGDVPIGGEIERHTPKETFVEYALSRADLRFLRMRGIARQFSYGQVIHKDIGINRYLTARSGQGSAILAVTDGLLAGISPRRRRIDLQSFISTAQ